MTNQEIMGIALQQSAFDCNCSAADFLQDKNIIVMSRENSRARKYLPLPLACDLVSYGNNIVAQVSEQLTGVRTACLDRYQVAHCFEMPNLHVLNDELQRFGLKVCFMAEYFCLM